MPDEACRLAKLEEKTEWMEKEIETKASSVELIEVKEQNVKILAALQELQVTNNRQKGFIGGMLFVLSGVAALATILVNKYL